MSNTIQATSLVPIRASLLKPTEAERDFKRRRESYKKKIGTKTGLAAYRELIQKHMIELSLETNRELVLGGGFSSDTKAHIPKQAHRRVVDWWNFTDALKVRNRSRRMSRDDTRSQLRHSKSRSRHRCRTKRHFCTNVKDTTDRRYKSRSRSRDTKTRRLYMDDSARYSARYRRQSDSKNRDRSPDRRHMYTKS
ncbi:hypothetical protein CCR75_001991 [Bremia lactucae]|uniref:Uncharacterized protein n=1 Tax=Bremia lactucae TaxID=4779 RepID=A0A976IME9_BRELC|nr:hypothetical protein CCR75_001991 [Bremia lactucae]